MKPANRTNCVIRDVVKNGREHPRSTKMAKTRNKQYRTYQEYLADMAKIRVTCAKCGRKDARLSPMGVLCPTCTFKKGA